MRERERERRGGEEEGNGGREKREGQRGKKGWEGRKKEGRKVHGIPTLGLISLLSRIT